MIRRPSAAATPDRERHAIAIAMIAVAAITIAPTVRIRLAEGRLASRHDRAGLVKDAGVVVGQQRALALHPPRELIAVAEMKSIEERTRIELRRGLIVAARHRRREFGDVAGHDRWIEAQLLGSGNRIVRPEITPQH